MVNNNDNSNYIKLDLIINVKRKRNTFFWKNNKKEILKFG